MSDPANSTTDMNTAAEPQAVVEAFLGALERLDIDEAVALLAPEIVYHNKGLPPARGKAAVERQLGMMARYGDGFEARIHNIATNGDIVLTERTDVIEIRKFRMDFWVCGTFEVRDGKIVLWRDYFDFLNITVAAAKGAVRFALDRLSA